MSINGDRRKLHTRDILIPPRNRSVWEAKEKHPAKIMLLSPVVKDLRNHVLPPILLRNPNLNSCLGILLVHADTCIG
jgi:hypothetical protein